LIAFQQDSLLLASIYPFELPCPGFAPLEGMETMLAIAAPPRAPCPAPGLGFPSGRGAQKLSQSSSAVEAMATDLAVGVLAEAAGAAGLAVADRAAPGAMDDARGDATPAGLAFPLALSSGLGALLAARAAVCSGAPLPPGSLKTETTRTS
jgi:hypothetical protein